MVLLEDVELTTTQIRKLLGISVEVSCKALLRLNRSSIIIVSKVVGRNKYYKVNPNFCVDDNYNINQLI